MLTLRLAFWVGIRLKFTLLLATLWIAVTPVFGQNTMLEVIVLKYRTAEQVMPVLKPLLDKSGSMSGMQNQLVVRTTPANLAELKRALASIDAMPRRLIITVRQDADIDRGGTSAEVSGRISSGNATAIISGTTSGGNVETRRGDDIARARIDSTRSLDTDRNTQTLQVLEGSRAFIRTGQSVPIPQRPLTRTIVNGGVVGQVGNTVEYRDVVTGFYALPRLAGDLVTIEISSQNDALARPEQNLPRGSVNVQGADTTVSGRLGEWIEVGSVVQGVSNQQSGVLGSTRSNSTDNRRILLKVDEIR